MKNMGNKIITPEEAREKVTELRSRIRQLRPDNCPFCGARHHIGVSRMGEVQPDYACCDDMIREAKRLEREIFGIE